MSDIDTEDIIRTGDWIRVSSGGGDTEIKKVVNATTSSQYDDRLAVKLEGESEIRYIRIEDIPEKIVSRVEDLESQVVLELRQKESMLQSEIARLLEQEYRSNMNATSVAKVELQKTLNAVRAKLQSHGARTSNWVGTDFHG
jgi:hypothetical protein